MCCSLGCGRSTIKFAHWSDSQSPYPAVRWALPSSRSKPEVSEFERSCVCVSAHCTGPQAPLTWYLHPRKNPSTQPVRLTTICCLPILTSKITEMPLRGSGAKNCSWATATSSLLEAYSRLEMFLSLILVTIQRTSPSIPPGWAPLFPDCAAVADSLSWPATGLGCSRLSWARSLACSLFSSLWTPSLQ